MQPCCRCHDVVWSECECVRLMATTVSPAKWLDGSRCCLDLDLCGSKDRVHILDKCAHWCHMGNVIERPVSGGDAVKVIRLLVHSLQFNAHTDKMNCFSSSAVSF